jgi:hypothetical protein
LLSTGTATGAGQPGLRRRTLGSPPNRGARGENVHVAIELRHFEATEGTRQVIHYEAAVRCKACMGRGSVGLPDPECDACGGSARKRTVSQLDVANLLQIEPCPACRRGVLAVRGRRHRSAERRIRLVVPPAWRTVHSSGSAVTETTPARIDPGRPAGTGQRPAAAAHPLCPLLGVRAPARGRGDAAVLYVVR